MELYRLDAKKVMRIWKIKVIGERLIIEYGAMFGKLSKVIEQVPKGLAGRSISCQVRSRMNSRINKQLAKGYFISTEEATKNFGKNELKSYKPMLAQQFNKQTIVDTTGALLQMKLDGNRMLVTKQDGVITAYTRNGKPVTTLDHITERLGWIREGQTVDGEVYVHGMPLKDINSRIRRKQEGTTDLQYHIYDTVSDKPFVERFLNLPNSDVFATSSEPTNHTVQLVKTYAVDSEADTEALFLNARRKGYEGLIMRLDGYGYEVGKRSKGLLKIKHRYDAEYKVIGVEVGRGGIGILVLELPNGKVVKGVAPGSKPSKIAVATNPDFYIGKLCTCSFAYLTDYGIPFHLTCDAWRDSNE